MKPRTCLLLVAVFVCGVVGATVVIVRFGPVLGLGGGAAAPATGPEPVRRPVIDGTPEQPAPPAAPILRPRDPSADPAGAPSVPGSDASPPAFEFADVLLDPLFPEGARISSDFDEKTVDFEGTRRPHSLAGGLGGSRHASSGLFWKLADLPDQYRDRAERMECRFALDDASAPGAQFQFEVRTNNEAPTLYDVKPGKSVDVTVPLQEVWRVDITARSLGTGTGRPIIVDPVIYFEP